MPAQCAVGMAAPHGRTAINLDSCAYPHIVEKGTKLTNETDTDVEIQTAEKGGMMQPIAKGKFRTYGDGLRCDAAQTLLSVKMLAETTNVAVAFTSDKAFAFDQRDPAFRAFMRDMVARGRGALIGKAEPNWIHELTDQNALDELVATLAGEEGDMGVVDRQSPQHNSDSGVDLDSGVESKMADASSDGGACSDITLDDDADGGAYSDITLDDEGASLKESEARPE